MSEFGTLLSSTETSLLVVNVLFALRFGKHAKPFWLGLEPSSSPERVTSEVLVRSLNILDFRLFF